MSEPDVLNLDEISSANAKAIQKIRQLTTDLKSVVEHELLLDDSSPRLIEVNSRFPNACAKDPALPLKSPFQVDVKVA